MLAEDFPLRQAIGPGKTNIIGVFLVDHIPAHPSHQPGHTGHCQGDDGQNVHHLVGGLQVKGCGNAQGIADGFHHKDIGQTGDGSDKHNIECADLVHQLIRPLSHPNAQGKAHRVGKNHRQNAKQEGISHFGHAVLHGKGLGVVIRIPGGVQQLTGFQGSCNIGRRMQIVRADLSQTGGIGDFAGHIRALRTSHCIVHIDSLVHHKRFTQVDREEILMNIGELTVTVQQILVIGSVAHDCRRKLLSAVHGIVQSKCQLALAHIALYFVNIVKFQQAGKVADGPLYNGFILGCIQGRLTAVGNLASAHDGIQAGHFVAFGGVVFRKLPDILRRQIRVLLRRSAQLHGVGPGFLVNGAVLGQLKQIIRIGYIVQIPILFPLTVHIGGLGVVGTFAEHGIRRKNQLPVHKGKDHHHDNDQHNRDREETANESI